VIAAKSLNITKNLTVCKGKGKGKAIPLQAWTDPEDSQDVEAPRFQDNRHMKMVR